MTLIQQLAELERAAQGLAAAPALAQLGHIPRVVAALIELLRALVHASERQRIIVENLERKKSDA